MGSIAAGCGPDSNQCELSKAVNPAPNPTIGEVFDTRIEEARRHVEQLCVKKAKLEALNMLHMPYKQIRDLMETYPF